MNEFVISTRRHLCAEHGCSHEDQSHDPCAVCPNGQWGRWECGEGTGLPVTIANSAAVVSNVLTGGPGTELSAMLRFVGLGSAPGCACKSRAQQMDLWGAERCEKEIEQIVGWLRGEAQRRKLPFSSVGARGLIRLAIYKARKAGATPLH